MSAIEKAVAEARRIAADNGVGYLWGGNGPTGFDCSGLVNHCWIAVGVPVNAEVRNTTRTMPTYYPRHGFRDVTSQVNLATGAGLRAGDVLNNRENHCALCVGNGRIVQARSDLDGQPGDSSGKEIREQAYYNYPWTHVFRYVGGGQASVPTVAATTYTVRSGDTLSGIATRHGMRWTQLAEINGIKPPYIIRPGAVLKLTETVTGTAISVTETAKGVIKTDQSVTEGSPGTYTVKSGDSLWGIAKKLLGAGWRCNEIAQLNGLTNANWIRPGQVLKIPNISKTTT